MSLIGILGKKRSGKDTFGDYLKEKYGYESYAFAKPLKDSTKSLFLLTDEQLYGDTKEVKDNRWNMSPREMLQFIGTIFRELTDGKFWLIHFCYYFQQNKHKNIVVTDCRYQNEVDIIKKLG